MMKSVVVLELSQARRYMEQTQFAMTVIVVVVFVVVLLEVGTQCVF